MKGNFSNEELALIKAFGGRLLDATRIFAFDGEGIPSGFEDFVLRTLGCPRNPSRDEKPDREVCFLSDQHQGLAVRVGMNGKFAARSYVKLEPSHTGINAVYYFPSTNMGRVYIKDFGTAEVLRVGSTGKFYAEQPFPVWTALTVKVGSTGKFYAEQTGKIGRRAEEVANQYLPLVRGFGAASNSEAFPWVCLPGSQALLKETAALGLPQSLHSKLQEARHNQPCAHSVLY